jgi:hypothetical protein
MSYQVLVPDDLWDALELFLSIEPPKRRAAGPASSRTALPTLARIGDEHGATVTTASRLTSATAGVG